LNTRWNSTGFRRRLCLRMLWPWPLTFWSQNLISVSISPYTTVAQIGWNFPHWFLSYGVHKLFGSLPAVTMLAQNLFSTSMNPQTSVTKIGLNSVRYFFKIWCSQGFRDAQIHALTHSLTDGQTRIRSMPTDDTGDIWESCWLKRRSEPVVTDKNPMNAVYLLDRLRDFNQPNIYFL